MQPGPGKYSLPIILFASMSIIPLHASLTTTFKPHSAITGPAQGAAQDAAARNSLRRDVAANPGDFLTFETESSAIRFISAHAPEAQREAEPRVIARGVLGYWHEKTLVVLPSLSALLR